MELDYESVTLELAAHVAAIEDAATREANEFASGAAFEWAEGYDAKPFALTDDEVNAATRVEGDVTVHTIFRLRYDEAIADAREFCAGFKERLDHAEHAWVQGKGYGANYDAEADAVEAEFDARFGASL